MDLESTGSKDTTGEACHVDTLLSNSDSEGESSQELTVPPSPMKKPRDRMLAHRGEWPSSWKGIICQTAL